VLCERCQKNAATLRYSEVVNGKVSVRNICKACLAELQGDATTGFEVAGAPTAKRMKQAEEQAEPSIPHRSCPTCGVALRVVLKTGRVGCSTCFQTFGEAIEPQLRGLHVALRHRGKVPRIDDIREKVRADLQSKRALLRTALKMENYETAASLRDDIKLLETGLGAASPGHN